MTPPADLLTALHGLIARHRRHIELSPGVGAEVQRYGLAVCDDIESDLSALLASVGAHQQDDDDVTRSAESMDLPASVSTRPPTELDSLIAEYKHIADNDREHRLGDVIWLVNELIYERDHAAPSNTKGSE